MVVFRVFSHFAKNEFLKLKNKPTASHLLTTYLKHKNHPSVISFAALKKDLKDDQFGWSYFNWDVEGTNYCILRTGCFPFVKYHCTKSPAMDLTLQDRFFTFLKIMNLGIPTTLYGLSIFLFTGFKEDLIINGCRIVLYSWYKQ